MRREGLRSTGKLKKKKKKERKRKRGYNEGLF
jgi:hypothetical protein